MNELDLDNVARTKDVRVDDIVARLDGVDDLDPERQLQVFTDLQSSLAEVLDSDGAVPEPTARAAPTPAASPTAAD